MPVPHRRAGAARLLALVVILAACAPAASPPPSAATTAPPATSPVPLSPAATGTPAPSREPVTGLDWGTAAEVARPADAFALDPDPTTGPAGPGTAGHPGHFPGQAVMADVANREGLLVAVGFVGPDPWRPIAWRSTDAEHWTLAEMGDRASVTPAFATSVTATPAGFVAVGRAGPAAAAWTSPDGMAWTRHDPPAPTPGGPAERMTVVEAGAGGLLAGGSAGPELFERHARVWRSTDGTRWTPVPEDSSFDGAEITALRPLDDGWLALARLGSGQRTTGSTGWRSSDGATWTALDDAAIAGGWVRGIAVAPDGALVAVGSEPDERGAWTWRSDDGGRTWSQAPETAALTHFGEKIRMTDVVATRDGVLAVGNLVGVQYGSGMSWLSADGLTWERSPIQAVFGQGEPLAVVAWGRGYVAVGDFGAPDNYIPRVWLTPPG